MPFLFLQTGSCSSAAQMIELHRFCLLVGDTICIFVIGFFGSRPKLCGTDQMHGLEVQATSTSTSIILSVTHFATSFIMAKACEHVPALPAMHWQNANSTWRSLFGIATTAHRLAFFRLAAHSPFTQNVLSSSFVQTELVVMNCSSSSCARRSKCFLTMVELLANLQLMHR